MPGKNVILITIDAMRADRLNCLGHPRKTTPNLDQFAKKGVLFTHAFSNAPTTAQSFPSILTSTYPLMYNDCIFENKHPLSKQRTTVAETLSRHNYSTCAFHSNVYLSTRYGYNRGFDTFEDYLGDRFTIIERRTKIEKTFKKILKRKPSKTSFLFRQLGKTIIRWHGKLNVPYKRAEVINRKATDWIKNSKPNGFFLWLHYMDTHLPYAPPKDFLPPSANLLVLHRLRLQLNLNVLYAGGSPDISRDDLLRLIDLYEGEVKYVDHVFGLFLSELEELGIGLDNTFFIVTADHGDEFMEHGGLSHSGKLYDELIHVPLIIRGPGTGEGIVVKQPVSLIDLSPTILELLGITKAPETFMGTSLCPILKGEKRAGSTGVISEWARGKKRRISYRTNEWKYILTLDEKGMQDELYDLQRDPKEKKDFSEEKKMKCEEFKTKLLEHILMEEKSRTKERISALKLRGVI